MIIFDAIKDLITQNFKDIKFILIFIIVAVAVAGASHNGPLYLLSHDWFVRLRESLL